MAGLVFRVCMGVQILYKSYHNGNLLPGEIEVVVVVDGHSLESQSPSSRRLHTKHHRKPTYNGVKPYPAIKLKQLGGQLPS